MSGETLRDRLAGPCVCDGRYAGCQHQRPCGAPNGGTGHGPWCAECNPRRLAHITSSLNEIIQGGT